jgi:putative transposase
VFVPKYRRRASYGTLRKQIGGILRELCHRQGVEILEGHAMPEYIRLCLSVPPKYSVVHTIDFLKGKSAIRIHRECLGQRRNFSGLHFWAKGYGVTTVGLYERTIVGYIRNQEVEEKRLEQMQLKGLQTLS